jgi:hypothetical protein
MEKMENQKQTQVLFSFFFAWHINDELSQLIS